MTQGNRKVSLGIYLVIDPSMEERVLLDKLALILKEDIVAVQIWDNFYDEQDIDGLVRKVVTLCHARNIPVLINNKWELLINNALDGVHFDDIPEDLTAVKEEIGRPFITGLTCNNDLSFVEWANKEQLDYISFCSVFPSSTSNSCELVNFQSIREAKKICSIPVFLAGGIKPENMKELEGLEYDGVAVISGIMSSDDPGRMIKEYNKKLKIH